jgi:alkylation response protein AidB-like acyl-CoA dehydrogenase
MLGSVQRMSTSDEAVFPRVDPVGPAVEGLIVPRAEVVADVVAPGAGMADAVGVDRAVLDALAAAGLLGAPLQPPTVQRELAELIAGADASTWFCWVQHQTPLRTLEGAVAGLVEAPPTALVAELLPGLRSGELLAAVAFAHVRRPGAPDPIATRVEGGWQFTGTLDWVTSWDIADVVMVMAQGSGLDSDRLVCAYLPAGRSTSTTPGLVSLPAGELLAMAGTHTRPIALHDVFVPDHRIGAVLDRDDWLAVDASRTSDANPSAFGVARGAIAELSQLAEQRSDAGMRELAQALVEECRAIRQQAYHLSDADADDALAERRAVRASSLDLCGRAATAVVVARSGSAMRRGHAAERRLREAMFLQVQAQTRGTRDASLALLTELSRRQPLLAPRAQDDR